MTVIAPIEKGQEGWQLHYDFLDAVEQKDIARARAFLEGGINPNQDVKGYLTAAASASITAMHIAARDGNIPMLQMLVDEFDGDINHDLGITSTPLRDAVSTLNNEDMVHYLANHPKIDLNHGHMLYDKTVVDTILEGVSKQSALEYLEIILDGAKDNSLLFGSGNHCSLRQLAKTQRPELLEKFLQKADPEGYHFKRVLEGVPGRWDVDIPMGAAADNGDIASMEVLKKHGLPTDFVIDPERCRHNPDHSHAVLTAARSEDGLDAYFKLAEWGVDLTVQDTDDENVIFACMSPGFRQPEVTMQIMKHAFAHGVTVTSRSSEGQDHEVFAHPFPTVIGLRNEAIAEMLVGGGGIDPREERTHLLEAIKHYRGESGKLEAEIVKFAEEKIMPMTKLPTKLPKDISGLTREQLLQTNEDDMALTDHPNTWFRFKTVQAELAQRGEAFTPDELRDGRISHSGKSWLAEAILLRNFGEIQAYFKAQGDSISAKDLVQPNGEATDVLKTIADQGQLSEIFNYEFWQDKAAHDLQRVYDALDESRQDEITNITQIKTALSRNNHHAGRVR